jgi:diaminohydroxyphosphoribosylaminopyrimidine deaminase / 5-amino-6-(5-phosphoribosylamino)uracil reductase
MRDLEYINRCISLASRAGKSTGINPKVGAVLVTNNEIIAEAYHQGWGQLHAERELLNLVQKMCTETDINLSDATLYINLEPCCHYGKTPPCTDIIIETGIKRVVFGMVDPNPVVAGEGISALEEAGIEVIGPVIPELCKRVNRGYISILENNRPWITIKSAQASNGKFANNDGSFLKITSVAQDEWSHKNLRATHDAIMVGVNTVNSDNCSLTTRKGLTKNEQKMYSSYRIILDPELQIKLDSKVISDEFTSDTIIITSKGDMDKKCELIDKGITIWECPIKDSIFDFSFIWNKCITPSNGFHGISSILVEGGPKTWSYLRNQYLVDEEIYLTQYIEH